jgi:hypothetical protein
VGTEKRERQKANRYQRRIEEQKVARTSAIKRNVVRWIIIAVLALGAVVLIAWIGGAFSSDDEPEATVPTTTIAPATTIAFETPEKPDVEIPAELPTELQITTLVDGEGAEAAVGDTVTVHYVGVRSEDGNYVGVRSEDGTEFDNSYDRGRAVQRHPRRRHGDPGLGGGSRRRQGRRPPPARHPGRPRVRRWRRRRHHPAGDALSFVVDVVSIEFAPPPPTLAPQADASECPATDGSQEQVREFSEYPPTCIDPTKSYTAEIVTNQGTMTVELYADRAPLTVNSFVTLARYKYFDGIICHRIIPGLRGPVR